MKIIRAWWVDNSTVAVSFSMDTPTIPEIKVVADFSVPHYKISRAPKTLFGRYCSYYIDGATAKFSLNEDNFENVSLANADYYLCGSFNNWGEAIGQEKWRMKRADSPNTLELDVPLGEIHLRESKALFKFASRDGRWLQPRENSPNVERDHSGNLNFRLVRNRSGNNVFFICFQGCCDIRSKISVEYNGVRKDVNQGELLRQVFSSKFLGTRLVNGKTEFSIFAPRAKKAYVVWNTPDNHAQSYAIEAHTEDGAVWLAKADSDLRECRYFWHIAGNNVDSSVEFNSRFQIADPYANAMLTSSGPSIVTYEDELPRAKAHTPPPWHELVIMEVHLRDVLARTGINPDEKLGFAGLTKWLKSPDCYLRRAGVNCVELQPIQEFTAQNYSDYEWGYMPVNWFAPASSYATNPEKRTQNIEFANLVDAFHEIGISVILDVVYNHVGEPNFLIKVDKSYYFKIETDGALTNFSGCGNDFRCGSPMATRMIIDSLKRMIINYGVDGFRFDLAELIGMKTLREIEVELKKVKPSIILIAEPWSFRGHIATHLRDTGFSSWNDGFREFVLQYVRGAGNADGMKYFLSGSLGGVTKWPAQTVNYIESHDDMCFYDRLVSNRENPSVEDVRRYKMGQAIVLLSAGIPMLAEGFDLLRTKGGKNNTYKDGAANELDYNRGFAYTGARAWLRALVEFRLSDAARTLRLAEAPQIGFFKFVFADDGKSIGAFFNANESLDGKKIFVAFNPSNHSANLLTGDLKDFKQIADIDRFNVRGLSDPLLPCDGVLTLPAVSLALFVQK